MTRFVTEMVDAGKTLAEMQAALDAAAVIFAMRRTGGRVDRASAVLGMPTRTTRRYLRAARVFFREFRVKRAPAPANDTAPQATEAP